MEWNFISASLISLIINLSYTVIALFVAVLALNIIDKKLLKQIDIQQELKENNLALTSSPSSALRDYTGGFPLQGVN